MNKTNALKFGLTMLAVAGAATIYARNLHIGDQVPQLKVDRWMKGTPVPNFERGKVYVVEFWATWCGPCKQAMPHLSALAKKYEGKVTFIGVDIWENEHSKPGEDLKSKANEFVKEMGDRMGYNVCAASDDGYMTTNWMKAAGQEGIPATFVIGPDSKIDWIGHPDYLEEPLSQIVNGSFDVKAFAAKTNSKIDKEHASAALYAKLMKPVEDAEKAKDYERVVSECDQAMAKCGPGQQYAFAMKKFEILAKHMPDKAYAEAVKVQSDPAQHWMASESFAVTPGLEKNCYMYALDFFNKKYKDQPQNPNGYAHCAAVYYQLGDPAKAAELFQKYADALSKMNLDPVTMAGVDKQLQKYKDAAAAAGK